MPCPSKAELLQLFAWWILLITRLKCKSSARVKIVMKKDWIVKKVFKSWKILKKM